MLLRGIFSNFFVRSLKIKIWIKYTKPKTISVHLRIKYHFLVTIKRNLYEKLAN